MVGRRSALGLLGLLGVVVACGTSVEYRFGPDGGAGGEGATGNTGGTGNVGNTGGTGNVANTGGTGNVGNVGGTGNVGNVGGTGNVGNVGGTGNVGNVGGTGNVGNVGGTGNVGNTGAGGSPCYPLTQCGVQCVDVTSNPQHCGHCFNPCGPEEYCAQGNCQCWDGLCGACSPADLGSNVPACAAAGSPDVAYTFTAAVTGSYVFDTIGSGYDTVLQLLDAAACGVIGCDDDAGGNLASRVTVQLYAGQTVVVVVDGYGGAAGTFALHVAGPPPPPCPMVDLGSMVPTVASGNTSTQQNVTSGACGGEQAGEVSYLFTAPAAASYTFTTQGSSYDTLIYLRDGSCFGPELGCDDDGGGDMTSRVQLMLAAGQDVVLFVDGWGSSVGAYVLRINSP
jgi:hypothetical protein